MNRLLADRTILAVIIAFFINITVVSGIAIIVDLLLLDLFTGFLLKFLSRACTWLYLVPIVIGLPNGKIGLSENIKQMGLLRIKPTRRIIAFTLIGITVQSLSIWLPSLLFSEWTADFSLLWPSTLLSINPGLWEEVFHRGIILSLLLKKYSENKAIFLEALLFSLSHLQNLFFGQPPIIMLGQLIFAFTGGLSLAVLYLRSRSLIPGILTHYFVDTFYLFFTFSLIQPGPNLILGGILMLASSTIASVSLTILLLKYFPKLENNVTEHDNDESGE